MCVLREQEQNRTCRDGDHFVPRLANRFGDASVFETVCVPGSPGWVGDHCFTSGDCTPGNRCAGGSGTEPGTCTRSCTYLCPDLPGTPWTLCVEENGIDPAPACIRQCGQAGHGAECAEGLSCELRQRNGRGSGSVCRRTGLTNGSGLALARVDVVVIVVVIDTNRMV
jgi:hypothetical protein